MGEATVRRANAEDGIEIAAIQLEVWNSAFSDVLPAQILGTSRESLAGNWVKVLTTPGEQVLLALENEYVVGFAHATGSDGSINLLYVRPAWARRGHGGRLFVAATAQLSAAGADHGNYWVPETDRATANFLRSVRWHTHGQARDLDTGQGILREIHWSGELDYALGGLPG